MRFVIQCVDHAEVETDKGVIGKIGKGFLVLAGICETDTRRKDAQASHFRRREWKD